MSLQPGTRVRLKRTMENCVEGSEGNIIHGCSYRLQDPHPYHKDSLELYLIKFDDYTIAKAFYGRELQVKKSR